MFSPSSFLLSEKCLQQVVHRSVETFTLPISHWVIGGGAGLGCTIVVAQLLDYVRLKAATFVWMNPLRYAVMDKPVCDEYLCDCFRCLVPSWYCNGVFRKDVGDDQDVFPPVPSWFKHCEVDRDYLQWLGGKEMPHGSVCLHAGLLWDLASLTVLTPFLSIQVHVRPESSSPK